jgi:SAP domain-containing ribonucleoprotein
MNIWPLSGYPTRDKHRKQAYRTFLASTTRPLSINRRFYPYSSQPTTELTLIFTVIFTIHHQSIGSSKRSGSRTLNLTRSTRPPSSSPAHPPSNHHHLPRTMATDYSKKKNAELEDLLRARSLPHTGKKADLIARLLQSDKDASNPPPQTTSTKSSTATAVADDEIDWDDEKDADKETSATPAAPAEPEQAKLPAPSAAGKAALAAGGQGQPTNPPAVPNQLVAEDPSTTSDLTVIQPSTTDPEPAKPTASESTTATPAPAPVVDFTQGLSQTSLDTELEKRKARAARFGLPVESDSEAVKALERAKKFGTAAGEEGKVVVGGLDSALPERARKRGREREERGGEEEKGAKRQDSRRREGRGGRGRGGRDGGRGQNGRGAGEGKKAEGAKVAAGKGEGAKSATGAVSEKDKLAAEARKKRFAAAA